MFYIMQITIFHKIYIYIIYIYVYVYIYAYICIYMYIYVHIYIYIHISIVCIYMYIHITYMYTIYIYIHSVYIIFKSHFSSMSHCVKQDTRTDRHVFTDITDILLTGMNRH